MNLKLDVVRLANEDVIVTSTIGVGMLGRHDIGEPYVFSWALCNTQIRDLNYNGESTTDYQGYTELGWYHCDANGNIIEKCDHGTTEEAVFAAHGIEPLEP